MGVREELKNALNGLYDGIPGFVVTSIAVPAARAAVQAYKFGVIKWETVYDVDMVIPAATSYWLVEGVSKRNWAETLEAAAVYFTKLGLDIANYQFTGNYEPLLDDAIFLPVMTGLEAARWYLSRK